MREEKPIWVRLLRNARRNEERGKDRKIKKREVYTVGLDWLGVQGGLRRD